MNKRKIFQYLDKIILKNYYNKKNETGYSSKLSDYIDLTGGIVDFACLCKDDELFISAFKEKLKKNWHLSKFFTHEAIVALSKKLVTNTFADKVFFFSNGAESNESALILSRRYAYKNFGSQKNIIICFSVNIGNEKTNYKGFGELGIKHADLNDINSVRKIINHYTCAVIIEPIQFDRCIKIATPYFVKQLYSLCHKFNALLIFNEIHCGIGRLGKLLAYMHYNIKPDIICTGNLFASYALLTNNKIGIGVHRSKNSCINLNCTVSKVMLDVIYKKEVLFGVNKKHQKLKGFLKRINLEFDFFKELRGIGLIIGIELKKDYRAIEVVKLAVEHNLLLLNAGNEVLRFEPSVIISHAEIDAGMKRLYKTIKIFNKNLNVC